MKYIVHLVRYRYDGSPVYLSEEVEADSPEKAQLLCECKVETTTRAMEAAGSPATVIKQALAFVTSIQIVDSKGQGGTVYDIEAAKQAAVRLQNATISRP